MKAYAIYEDHYGKWMVCPQNEVDMFGGYTTYYEDGTRSRHNIKDIDEDCIKSFDTIHEAVFFAESKN